jgi:hypothetical protein
MLTLPCGNLVPFFLRRNLGLPVDKVNSCLNGSSRHRRLLYSLSLEARGPSALSLTGERMTVSTILALCHSGLDRLNGLCRRYVLSIAQGERTFHSIAHWREDNRLRYLEALPLYRSRREESSQRLDRRYTLSPESDLFLQESIYISGPG